MQAAELERQGDSARAKTLAAVCAACGLLGIGSWLFYFLAFAGARGEDWMVFYMAARGALEGKFALIYSGDKLTDALNVFFAHWLAKPLPLHPFLYPPHYLLILAPFGTMPPGLALALFLSLSFAALAVSLWFYAERKDERLLYILSALVCPTAAIVAILGQNSFLSCAILVGGFKLSERRPVLGGLLLGLLSYKPQLALMVPVALLASRQWKVLAAAAASALILMAASLVLFGVGAWRDWISVMTVSNALSEKWNTLARVNGQNIFAYAAFLGAPLKLANALQIAATATGALFVYWYFRHAREEELKLVVILAVTALTAPHFLTYDAMMSEIAATVFLAYTLRNGADLLDSSVAVLLWLSPLVNPPTVFAIGVATPILIALFLLRAARRDFLPEGPRSTSPRAAA